MRAFTYCTRLSWLCGEAFPGQSQVLISADIGWSGRDGLNLAAMMTRRSGHAAAIKKVLVAAIGHVPARLRRKLLIRIDGAGASHDFVKNLLAISSPQWKVLSTCGWTITEAEAAIMAIPASARKPGIAQDGGAEQDKEAAELTAWTRLLGHHDDGEVRNAEPDTLRPDLAPPRQARPPARPGPQPDRPWTDALLTCWNRLRAPRQPDQHQQPRRQEGGHPARSEPGTPGASRTPALQEKRA
jgi:hypothetical protein